MINESKEEFTLISKVVEQKPKIDKDSDEKKEIKSEQRLNKIDEIIKNTFLGNILKKVNTTIDEGKEEKGFENNKQEVTSTMTYEGMNEMEKLQTVQIPVIDNIVDREEEEEDNGKTLEIEQRAFENEHGVPKPTTVDKGIDDLKNDTVQISTINKIVDREEKLVENKQILQLNNIEEDSEINVEIGYYNEFIKSEDSSDEELSADYIALWEQKNTNNELMKQTTFVASGKYIKMYRDEIRDDCDKTVDRYNAINEVNYNNLQKKEELMYKCEHCGENVDLITLKNHLGIKQEKMRLECEYCGMQFDHESNLRIHIRMHTGETSYECDYCRKICKRLVDLEKHLRSHTGETDYECEYCRKKFNRFSHLERHVRIHTGETPFKCEYCDKRFKRNSYLKTHMMIHTGDSPHVCEYCGKKFNQKCNLRTHLRVHTLETPFECNHCGRKFKNNSYLKSHVMIHTGETPFECEQCGKKFNKKQNLKRHLLIHSGEMPYECRECGRKFNHKGNLNAHLIIHKGEMPYQCDICGKKFSQVPYLKAHLKIHIKNATPMAALKVKSKETIPNDA